jgi:alkylation response protein AidB-like acyl-CoA dehydrogenase
MQGAAGHGDPSDLTGLDEEFERALLRQAGALGFLGVSLPTAVGGGGRPPAFRAAFELEVAFHDAPLVDTAVTLVGGPLLRFGSPAQHDGLLRRAVAGEITACIAYTESGAGSDLGAVSTAATLRRDGGFELSGTKVLVTGAHKADWCLTIARTRPGVPARDGLSMLLVDMRSPGVSVRRHPTMNGWTLCDVVFDGVAVPGEGLLGTLDGGWGQLMTAVAGEAASLFHVGFAERLLRTLADALEADGRQDDPVVRDRLGDLRARLDAARRLGIRAATADGAVAAAMAKIYTTELLQEMTAAAADLVGAAAGRWAPLFDGGRHRGARLGYELLERVHATIGGGTNETKRTLLAYEGLGLPRPGRR